VIEFDATAKNFVCPRCKDECNCTYCSRKRGEVYISSTQSRTTPSQFEIKPITIAKPVSSVVERSPIRPPVRYSPIVLRDVSGPVHYWGTVYDLEGDIIGSAFVDDEDEDVVVTGPIVRSPSPSPPPEPKPPRRRARIMRRRRFVGQLQASWHLEGEEISEPSLRRSTIGLAPDSHMRRKWYVGQSHPLFLKVHLCEEEDDDDKEEEEGEDGEEGEGEDGEEKEGEEGEEEEGDRRHEDDFGRLSPLTPLSDEFSCLSASVDDVSRAISLGLSALHSHD
jgi:hypothetical protein